MKRDRRIAALALVVSLVASLTIWAGEGETAPAAQTAKSGPCAGMPPQTVAARAATTSAPADPPDAAKGNSNELLQKYRGRVTISASTYWPGWPPNNAIDCNLASSWFTALGDAAALDTKPWIKIEFPEAVTVKRVTVLGNRDPAWLKGFTIRTGRLELLDADGRVLWTREIVGQGERSDFDFAPDKPLAAVTAVRFDARDDEGQLTVYKDVAIGEMMVE
jgi:hypothetical protein